MQNDFCNSICHFRQVHGSKIGAIRSSLQAVAKPKRVDHVGKMKWFLEIGIFAASILAGLLLGDLVPGQFLSKSWRIAIAAMLIGIGIILAIIGFFS